MKNVLYIVTGNHNHINCISDHIQIVRQLEDDELTVVLTKLPIRNANNIIIEDFSNPYFIELLFKLKKQFANTRLNLLMTEVPSRSMAQGIVLNEHIAQDHSLIVVNLIKILFWMKKSPLLYKIFKGKSKFRILKNNFLTKYFKKNSIRNLKLFKNFFSYFKTSVFFHYLRAADSIRSDEYQLQYMIDRGQKLSQVVTLFDGIIDMHPLISLKMEEVFQLKSTTILPKITFNFPFRKEINKYPTLCCTGTKSKYRRDIIDSLTKNYEKFKIIDVGFLSSKDLNEISNYTLNLPQTPKWPLSSPVRVYRSIYAGVIPIMYKKYGDHPIEKCSALLSDIIKEDGTLSHIQSKDIIKECENYNLLADGSLKEIKTVLDTANPQFNKTVQPEQVSDTIELTIAIPQLIGPFKNFNIVAYLDNYVGVPLQLGPIDLLKVDYLKNENIFVDKSLSTLKQKISVNSVKFPQVILLGTIYMEKSNYNIVDYDNSLYLLNRAKGKLDTTTLNKKERSEYLIHLSDLSEMCFEQGKSSALKEVSIVVSPYLGRIYSKNSLHVNNSKLTVNEILDKLKFRKSEITLERIFEYELTLSEDTCCLSMDGDALLTDTTKVKEFLALKILDKVNTIFKDYLVMETKEFNILSHGNHIFSLKKDQEKSKSDPVFFTEISDLKSFLEKNLHE